jgi:hypothetical protein
MVVSKEKRVAGLGVRASRIERIIMTRITSSAAIALLVAGAALAASRTEPGTYVSGNVTGIDANTGGTLQLPEDNAMVFRAGLASVPVPYASIKSAELGATRTHSSEAPLYKVWSLPKRFTGKTHTQYLTVAFKGEDGEDKTMTLEFAQPIAATVLSTIESHTHAGSAKVDNAWWGDDIWKTTRNADKWKQTGGVPAGGQ